MKGENLQDQTHLSRDIIDMVLIMLFYLKSQFSKDYVKKNAMFT